MRRWKKGERQENEGKREMMQEIQIRGGREKEIYK